MIKTAVQHIRKMLQVLFQEKRMTSLPNWIQFFFQIFDKHLKHFNWIRIAFFGIFCNALVLHRFIGTYYLKKNVQKNWIKIILYSCFRFFLNLWECDLSDRIWKKEHICLKMFSVFTEAYILITVGEQELPLRPLVH